VRILYYYSSTQIDTGSPKALAGLIEALDRSRYHPMFLTADAQSPLATELVRRRVELVAGGVTEVSWRTPLRSAAAIGRAAALLREARADVLHVNEFGWNFDIVLAAPVARVPVILHVHNPLVIETRNLNRLAASRVVFVSEAQRAAATGAGRLGSRSVVLHNPVDIARFESGRNIRDSLGHAPDDVVVATICQITPNKGLDVLLDVARALVPRWPRLHFVIAGRAGQGHEAYAHEIIAAAGGADLAGRVQFLGSRDDIPDILASSDVFFLPTRTETFGIVVAEAMAASLPVVTTPVGGIPEIIATPREGRLVEADDVAGFVSALEGLIRDPEARRRLGRDARASLDGRFDRETFSRALDALYGSL
jgi:glycosyltransferase involved in cell wall biosynthesis